MIYHAKLPNQHVRCFALAFPGAFPSNVHFLQHQQAGVEIELITPSKISDVIQTLHWKQPFYVLLVLCAQSNKSLLLRLFFYSLGRWQTLKLF